MYYQKIRVFITYCTRLPLAVKRKTVFMMSCYMARYILEINPIVNREDWLGSPANTGIKGANKDAKIYVGRSTTLHNILFFAHTPV